MKHAIALLLALASQAHAQSDPASVAAGQDVYMVFRQTCHGATAQGGGPLAEIMTREPPDLTRLALRNDGRFPTEAVARQIDGRDPLLGHGGEMPVFGPVFDTELAALATPAGQPMLTDRTIVDLIHWLQSIQEAE